MSVTGYRVLFYDQAGRLRDHRVFGPGPENRANALRLAGSWDRYALREVFALYRRAASRKLAEFRKA